MNNFIGIRNKGGFFRDYIDANNGRNIDLNSGLVNSAKYISLTDIKN